MRTALFTLAAAVVFSTGAKAQVGQPAPALDAVKWYNTPPLALEQLQDKTVLVEVFRTW